MDRKISGREALIGRIVSIGCFAVLILLFTSAQIFWIESGGVLSTGTLTIDSTTTGYIVLFTVFFLFMALLSTWYTFLDYRSEGRDD
jgi:hypothetical protein